MQEICYYSGVCRTAVSGTKWAIIVTWTNRSTDSVQQWMVQQFSIHLLFLNLFGMRSSM